VGDVLLGAVSNGVTRAEDTVGAWRVERVLEGQDVRCLAAHPVDARIAYAGTQGDGLFRSDDRGRTWWRVDPSDAVVKAIAPSRHEPDLIWIALNRAP
jgi:hypothetical protein